MAWIFTIETNIINRYYQLKNRYEFVDDEVVLDVISDNSETVEEKVIKNEYLNKLLNELNEFEREVIFLHLVSDLKFKEIAEQLNKPLSTILSKYNRAIKKLQIIAKEVK